MNEDIASIIVSLDQKMQELKRETRSMIDADRNKLIEIILEMRWNLARALTAIGKE
jgi:hypothetical protein